MEVIITFKTSFTVNYQQLLSGLSGFKIDCFILFNLYENNG